VLRLFEVLNDSNPQTIVLRLVDSPGGCIRLVSRAHPDLGLFVCGISQAADSGIPFEPRVVSLAFTLYGTMTALTLPFAGRLIDRFGPRRVILA
jgi:MFS family permease